MIFVVLRLGVLTLIPACSEKKTEWRVYKEVDVAAPVLPASAGMPTMMQPAAGVESPSIEWTAPEGWAEFKGSGMRLATFDINSGGQSGVCTIVVLGGAAGGLEANVARWIGQLGLKPLAADEMKTFIGKQQTIKSDGGLEVFIADMTTLASNETAESMIASVINVDDSTCFVKLTGAAGLLKNQHEKFTQLCKSLKKSAQAASAMPATMPPMMQPARMDSAGAAATVHWKTPDGWNETRGSGMRVATFSMPSGGPDQTCTIVVLGGAAGGLEANVARWIGQLNMKSLAEDEMKTFVAKQQTFKSDGGFDVFVADLTTLAPGDAAASMLAAIASIDDSTCFVKLTGTSGKLKTEKEIFMRLCRSLTK